MLLPILIQFDAVLKRCNTAMLKGSCNVNSLQECGCPGGGGVLPYMGYTGMCRCEGYGFQAVYSRIGYINQSVWL